MQSFYDVDTITKKPDSYRPLGTEQLLPSHRVLPVLASGGFYLKSYWLKQGKFSMKLLSVTYKINNDEPHYVDFQNLLIKYPSRKISNSSYIIETNLSPKEVYEELRMQINQSDTLIISKFANPWHGHCNADVIDWIIKRSNFCLS